MKFEYHFLLYPNQSMINDLAAIGIQVTEHMNVLRIKECDEKLPGLLEIVRKPEYKDLVDYGITYNPDAIDKIKADALLLAPRGLVDYIPFDGLKYLTEVFDSSNACPKDPCKPYNIKTWGCGLGFIQTKPFKLRVTKLDRKNLDIFVLNEHADVLFVSKELYEQVFKNLGIDFWPVIDYRSGKSSEKYVQLRIEDEVELDDTELIPTVCEFCKKTRYKPLRGWYPPRPLRLDLPISLSVQKFGIEGSAESHIIVNAALYRKMREYGIKHNIFWPCADEGLRYPEHG